VLSELLDDSAYFSSYVGGIFMLFVQALGQLEHLGMPLGNVSLHLVVVMGKQRVFDVLSENLTLDKVSSLDKLIEGLEGDLNFFEFRVFCQFFNVKESFSVSELVNLIVSVVKEFAELVGLVHVLISLRERTVSDDAFVLLLKLIHVFFELVLLVLKLVLHLLLLCLDLLFAEGNSQFDVSRSGLKANASLHIFSAVLKEVLVEHEVMSFDVLVECNHVRASHFLGLLDEGA
jgi:hypothetical protein